MCTRPHILPRPGVPEHRYELYKNIMPKAHFLIVPCGRCLECLKRKQNDISGRCVIEANARGSMHFLTLTYREETLPVSITFEVVNKESGEVVDRSWSPSVISYRKSKDRQQLSLFHEKIKDLRLSPLPRYGYSVIYEDDKYLLQHCITPSLCRRDVRLWLKAARMAYFREFGEKLDFSYLSAGEYGPNTARPHYHLALFGLTDKQAYFLAERWKKRYGNYDLKSIPALNPDGSCGFARCARYISKYISKGVFECRSCVDLRAEKPRSCVSIAKKCGLGDSFLTPGLIDYFTCKDLFPSLDVMNPNSVGDLVLLAKEVLKRSIVTIGDFSFSLPNKFVRKLWFYYDDFQKSYVSTPLRTACQDFIQIDLFNDYCRKFEDSSPGLFGADHLLFGSEASESSFISQDERNDLQQLACFYKSSIY